MSATPGPWTFNDDDWSVEAGHHIICEMHGDNAEANARLIAAAPELLEALKALAQLEPMQIRGVAPSDHKLWQPSHGHGLTLQHVLDARAAIAKAEGRDD